MDEGYNQKTVPEMREALAHTAGLRADTRAVQPLHLKKATMELTDNDPFKGISETRDAYRG